MESKDLLHPENDENQNFEVNTGSSSEDQNNANLIENNVTEMPVQEITIGKNDVMTEEEINSQEEESNIMVTEPSVTDMMAEIETTQHPLDEQDDEDDENREEGESIEKMEANYAHFTFEQAIEELHQVVLETNFNKIKQRVGILKSKVLEQLRNTRKEQLDIFIAEGGDKDEFIPEVSELEKKFNEALQIYKNNKAKFIESLEAEKQKNLEAKNEIIEGLKNLIESEANLKELNDKFKEYQEQWKEIGPVPQNESTNLWQNYHFYVEKFFDILRINKELRSLDLKKNLEQKIKLCETAESLLIQDSINKSFKALQQLHDEWKEIGPVPEDKKDEIWERFKNASDQINQRRREYYDKLYSEQQNNYNAKVVLCEQAEELANQECATVKENNDISEKMAELLKVWKTLGPAPVKLNDEIWNRFKGTLDKFFQNKKEYFQQIKDVQMQNYNQKLNLAIQAEAIAERTDWKQATDEILNLQKEWKEIGAIPRKYAEQIWKRFRGACDKFFAAKADYFSNIKEIEAENLQKKEDLIQKILGQEFTDDKAANLDVMKAYQREWTELGHVPKKDKDRIYTDYREAVNKRFAELKVNNEEIKRDNFRNKIDHILNNPNADRLIDKEKRFLINKVSQLKEDLILWENNLGFFASSKNADLLKAEFSKKIDLAKAEVKELEYKIRMMNSPKKKEEEKPVEPTETIEKKDE
ncbi:MAG: DUF349 domain-containing protein [Bacteroidales bacterium]